MQSGPEAKTLSGSVRCVRLAADALTHGRGILLMDDINRQNGGGPVFPAEKISVSRMALMIRECSGIVCLCMAGHMAKKPDLPLMVENNTSRYGTVFTVSAEAAEGVTTKVSAFGRIRTIRAAISPDATASDLNRPGHIFPGGQGKTAFSNGSAIWKAVSIW